MEIKFIVNCFNQEEYWPYLKYILDHYQKIKPTYRLIYNGNDANFPADVRIPNRGHGLGDYDLIIAGYNALKDLPGSRWIKLGVDSWLLDENKLIEIFMKMEENKCGYSGIWWNDWPGANLHYDVSMDIVPADIRYGNFFELIQSEPVSSPGHIELWLYRLLQKHKMNIHFLEERFPICEGRDQIHTDRWNQSITENRFLCPKLGWCGSHKLEVNINFLRNWAWANNRDDILEFIKASAK